jgi:hypothetical protein
MRVRHTPAVDDGTRVTRFAWLVSFFATLLLVAILLLAKSAQALTIAEPPTLGTPAAAAPLDDESEEEGEDAEEIEAAECEEAEDEEAEEECEKAIGPEAPEECLLTGAQATVFASNPQDKIRLVVRYTAAAPTLVAVDYGLHGSKGSLYLGESRKAFARTGVFRQTERLSEPQMAKAMGAKDFTVQLYAVHAPRYCRHVLDRHLTVRHTIPSGLTWLDPDSSARASHAA